MNTVCYLRGSILFRSTVSRRNSFQRYVSKIFEKWTRFYGGSVSGPRSEELAASVGRVRSEQLVNRGVVRVSGPDAASFLQGLVTNDMKHLEEMKGSKTPSIYALMLNHQGRVLYDVIIYLLNANQEKTSYLVECDDRVTTDLCKHLNMFKIRKKVDIVQSSDEFQIWNLLPTSIEYENDPSVSESQFTKELESIDSDRLVASTKDPRLLALGLRLVVTEGTKLANVDLDSTTLDSDYTIRRLRYGIGEGISDLPPGNCFPLECNADYLHGISFHKGCYIGQELTARTHHTGVVRKRLLPLIFDSTLEFLGNESEELLVKNEKGKAVGRIRGHRERFGLGLMRIQECLQQPQKLFFKGTNGDIEVKVHKPFWWPLEAPKENLAASKT